MSCAPNFHCNVDVLLQYLVEKVPVPIRDLQSPPLMRVVRSFDINMPGTPVNRVKGGVVGGTLERGVLRIAEIVEIRPGIVRSDKKTGKITATPLLSKVMSLFSESNPLRTALPGGLIAVGLLLDPSLTRQDRLVGQVVGRKDELPPVFSSLHIEYNLMKRTVGDTAEAKVARPALDEVLAFTIGSANAEGRVTDAALRGRQRQVKVDLDLPVCADVGDKVSISRKVNMRWRLIGWGKIVAGKPLVM